MVVIKDFPDHHHRVLTISNSTIPVDTTLHQDRRHHIIAITSIRVGMDHAPDSMRDLLVHDHQVHIHERQVLAPVVLPLMFRETTISW